MITMMITKDDDKGDDKKLKDQSKKLNPKLRTEDAKNTRGKMDISPEDKAEEERGSEV